mgnify:FL=1
MSIKAKRSLQNMIYLSGKVVRSVSEVKQACNEIGGNRWVAKAQVHAGGRGKSGGVALCDTVEEVSDFAKRWIGQKLVTYQTDKNGQLVNCILIEECTDIADELYYSTVVDRSSKEVAIIASSEGGVNIEKVAEESPEKIASINLDGNDISIDDLEKICSTLELNDSQSSQMKNIVKKTISMFFECDLSLLEINPLVIKQDGNLHCLDAKINIDSNALFRQKDLHQMHDPTQEDPRESEAAKYDLSYVSLDGNIGCMVNGAGLAMGTMDTIKFFNGNPANFLDVGGTATQERVAKAFKIILADPEVKVVLVNIFGGIVRCDLIAEGIVAAIDEVEVEIPVVVRLEGNNAEKGLSILSKSSTKIQSANSLEEAARTAVDLAK